MEELTIVASQKGNSTAGQVFITNSIEYAENPLITSIQ